MDLALQFHSAYRFQDKTSSYSLSMRRFRKAYVCCKKPTSTNPSKANQEEILSLLKRIQISISKGEPSHGDDKMKNRDESSLTTAILDVLEKSRKNTRGDVSVKEEQLKSPIPSALGPRGKLTVTKNDKALEEMVKKEEKRPLIETMKLAELKEVAKKREIKGHSKLKKSELLKLLRPLLILIFCPHAR